MLLFYKTWLNIVNNIFPENNIFFSAKQIPNTITICTAKAMPNLQNLLDFFKIYDTI